MPRPRPQPFWRPFRPERITDAAFDTSRVVKIEGTITQFRWINPHASIKIDGVTAGDDPDGVWTVEMTAPNVLINQGWTRTALKQKATKSRYS